MDSQQEEQEKGIHKGDCTLICGDCLDILPTIETDSIDVIFTDPPYPFIKRPYGYWTEETWLPMMQEVVRQGRRILKPHGSMVMVLQPNSEKVGKMRLWLWKFMVWCYEDWNVVQDVWWWNITTPPTVHTHQANGLMRPSTKACLWVGNPDCYRNQDAVLLPIAEATLTDKRINRHELEYSPSGLSTRRARALQRCKDRGGSTPFNLLVASNSDSANSAGANGHGAGTPLKLTDWWLRYLSKPGDTVLDPFNGSGTTGVAAKKLGRKYIGIEKMEKYVEVSKSRLAEIESMQLELKAND